MTPRERTIRALEHEEPDRVPLGITIKRHPLEILKKHFNVTEDMVLCEKLGIDGWGWMGVRIGREPSEEFKRSGKDKPNANGVYENEFGVKYRLGSTGRYWHWIYHPLQNEESVDEYEFPEIDIATQFTKAEENVKKYGDRYVIAGHLTHWGFF